ncbi:uncharacterized protein V2V93DRAFT_35582 [Kockiozyma suomiensis]|uniref:uncharacterized protein n=1 Tax=Kockiozyma suomiensis TaxID=1337062 RepID=UPI003343D939
MVESGCLFVYIYMTLLFSLFISFLYLFTIISPGVSAKSGLEFNLVLFLFLFYLSIYIDIYIYCYCCYYRVALLYLYSIIRNSSLYISVFFLIHLEKV